MLREYNLAGIYENKESYELFSKYLKLSFNLEQANFLDQVGDYKLLYTHKSKRKSKKNHGKIYKIRFPRRNQYPSSDKTRFGQ